MVDFFLIDQPQLAASQADDPNDTITTALEAAIKSAHAIYTKTGIIGDVSAATLSDDPTSEYRRFLNAVLVKFSGALGGSPATINYTVPSSIEKLFHFHNALDVDVIVKQGAGSGTRVRAGLIAMLYATGSDVINVGDPDLMQFDVATSLDTENDWFLTWNAFDAALRRVRAGDLGGTVVESGLEFRGALAYLTANQNILTGADRFVDWDAALYDTEGMFSPTGSPGSGFTIPSGVSRVRLWAGIMWDTNTTNSRYMFITRNAQNTTSIPLANTGLPLKHMNPSNVNEEAFAVESGAVACSPGDIFEVQVFQDSGGTRQILADEATYFAIEIIE